MYSQILYPEVATHKGRLVTTHGSSHKRQGIQAPHWDPQLLGSCPGKMNPKTFGFGRLVGITFQEDTEGWKIQICALKRHTQRLRI